MQEARKKFGKRIAELRRKRGLTQEGLAHACGVHRNYLSRVERGEYNVTLAVMCRIASALRVPLFELFNGM